MARIRYLISIRVWSWAVISSRNAFNDVIPLADNLIRRTGEEIWICHDLIDCKLLDFEMLIFITQWFDPNSESLSNEPSDVPVISENGVIKNSIQSCKLFAILCLCHHDLDLLHGKDEMYGVMFLPGVLFWNHNRKIRECKWLLSALHRFVEVYWFRNLHLTD